MVGPWGFSSSSTARTRARGAISKARHAAEDIVIFILCEGGERRRLCGGVRREGEDGG